MKLVPVVLTLLCSCVLNEDEQLSETEQFVKPNCDDWGCGTNSPQLDMGDFHFLYANGLENPQGYSIESFERNGTPYIFSVQDGRISAKKHLGQFLITAYVDAGLIGMDLHINYRGSPRYVVRITGYERIWSWATKPGTLQQFPVHTYTFHWTDSRGIRRNLCSHPGIEDETLGMNEFYTLVFEGDVIDSTSKSVSSAINNNVINFGCAGSALAKLMLTGYTEVAKRLSFTTLPPERQTMLKMFVADYCGNGVPYTVAKQPLQWADDKQWNNVTGPAQREALWGPNGATCLNMPRLLANPSTNSLTLYPEITQRSDIPCAPMLAGCGPNGGSPYFPDAPSKLVSSNPM